MRKLLTALSTLLIFSALFFSPPPDVRAGDEIDAEALCNQCEQQYLSDLEACAGGWDPDDPDCTLRAKWVRDECRRHRCID